MNKISTDCLEKLFRIARWRDRLKCAKCT